jgi:hypothetical protein
MSEDGHEVLDDEGVVHEGREEDEEEEKIHRGLL